MSAHRVLTTVAAHGTARERNAVAVAHRERPPGHCCRGAARTSPTFATVAIQQSAGAAGAFECAGRAGRLPVLSRAARQRARTHVSREDSTAQSSSASPAATSTAQGGRVGGLPPSCRATPHPRATLPQALSVVCASLTEACTGHAPLGSRGGASRDCHNSEHTRTRLSP